MDARNVTVLIGLLMLGVGLAVHFSWPVALIVVGSALIVGPFAAAAVSPARSE